MIAAGFDNGDIKLFDLKAMKIQWSTNVMNGVCGLQFDRLGAYQKFEFLILRFYEHLQI